MVNSICYVPKYWNKSRLHACGYKQCVDPDSKHTPDWTDAPGSRAASSACHDISIHWLASRHLYVCVWCGVCVVCVCVCGEGEVVIIRGYHHSHWALNTFVSLVSYCHNNANNYLLLYLSFLSFSFSICSVVSSKWPSVWQTLYFGRFCLTKWKMCAWCAVQWDKNQSERHIQALAKFDYSLGGFVMEVN